MAIPIIFIHKGYSSYMEYSLRQARYTNPDSEIILLGDESNNKFPFVTHINIKDYFKGASEFAKIYKHYSTNPYNYELFCFQRWFILEEFLQEKTHEVVMVVDSDVMLYTDTTKVYESFFKDCDISAIFASEMKIVNIAICYLKTKNVKAFNIFIISSFANPEFHELMSERWKIDIKENKVGAISDMTLITEYFYTEQERLKFASLNEVKGNSVFDNNVNESSCFYQNEYAYSFGKKKIKWNNGTPFCLSISGNKLIKFNCLHLQGPAKYLCSAFYAGPKFQGKSMLSFKFFFLNLLAFWYKTLRVRYLICYFPNLFSNEKHHNAL